MGPGPDGPGKLTSIPHTPLRRYRLQWGRGRMASENLLARVYQCEARQLQWGRGRMAPENENCVNVEVNWQELQWGRGRMAPENS